MNKFDLHTREYTCDICGKKQIGIGAHVNHMISKHHGVGTAEANGWNPHDFGLPTVEEARRTAGCYKEGNGRPRLEDYPDYEAYEKARWQWEYRQKK